MEFVEAVDAEFFSCPVMSRIICTRFCTIAAVLLRRIKKKNNKAEIKKLIVETLGPLQGRHEVFIDGSTKLKLPLLESMALEMQRFQKNCRFSKSKFVRGSALND